MGRVGVVPGVPEQADGDFRNRVGQEEAVQAAAKVSGESFRNGGDEVRRPRQCERFRKAADDDRDRSFQAERFECVVHRPVVVTPARNEDVTSGGVAFGRHFAVCERMSRTDDADEVIAKKVLRPDFRTHGRTDDAHFQIDPSVAQQYAFLVGLGDETQPHAGRFFGEARDEFRSEVFNEALTGSQGEGSNECVQVELFGGTQDFLDFLNEPADPFAEFERAGRGNEVSSGPDQEGIAGRFAQAGQCPAHRGRTEAQPFGRPRDAAFREKNFECDQQIEIGARHAPTLAQPVSVPVSLMGQEIFK